MAPLFETHTKNTTVTKLRGCSVELQGSSKVGIQDTLVFLICLMCWGGRLFLKGNRRLNSVVVEALHGSHMFCLSSRVRWRCVGAQRENTKRILLLFSYGNIIC